MTGNLTPWVVLAGVVIVSLLLKGYIKLPGTANAAPPAPKPQPRRPDPLDGDALGRAFAKAKRQEAEDELAEEIAQRAGDSLKAAFKLPFSPPSGSASPAPTGGAPTP